jgi:uncharacterized membrane protein (Fun14 family)
MEATGTLKQEVGLLDTLKEKLNPGTIIRKISQHQSLILEMALYLCIGFLAGFLLKKYGKFIFVLILCFVALILAQQMGLIAINVYWDKIQELFGIQPVSTLEGSLSHSYWEWVKGHLALVVSFSVGFLFGIRLG